MSQRSSLLGGALVLLSCTKRAKPAGFGLLPRCANSRQQELIGLCSLSAAHEVPLAIVGPCHPLGKLEGTNSYFEKETEKGARRWLSQRSAF